MEAKWGSAPPSNNNKIEAFAASKMNNTHSIQLAMILTMGVARGSTPALSISLLGWTIFCRPFNSDSLILYISLTKVKFFPKQIVVPRFGLTVSVA